jgi:hypothetical protein
MNNFLTPIKPPFDQKGIRCMSPRQAIDGCPKLPANRSTSPVARQPTRQSRRVADGSARICTRLREELNERVMVESGVADRFILQTAHAAFSAPRR